jgi:SAM-dependent methyltransferase
MIAGQHLRCHACHKPGLTEVAAHTPAQAVTSDCRPWPYASTLLACPWCGLVQKKIDDAYTRTTHEIYKSYAMYAQGQGVEQAAFTSQGVGAPRSAKIISWAKQQITLPADGSLLEVGSGNGSFLRTFSADHKNWQLVGTEYDTRNRAAIEAIPNTRFYPGDLKDLDSRFDLIVGIHVVEHIFNPESFLSVCREKLADCGKILIEVPNFETSPFDPLIIDHCSHFSVEALIDLITRGGFKVTSVSTTAIDKEISLLIEPDKKAAPAPVVQDSARAARAVRILEGRFAFYDALLRKAHTASGQIGVFGSSIAASWLFGELKEKVAFFIDEDPSRIGQRHLGIPILGVSQIPANVPVLLPMDAQLSGPVKARLLAAKVNVLSL